MKWFALALTIVLWAATWPQILPANADLPACHMFVLILASGTWTVYLFAKDRRQRRPEGPRCQKCGYLLIGLPEPRCPECGTPFEKPEASDEVTTHE
jgi:hypothetical protein